MGLHINGRLVTVLPVPGEVVTALRLNNLVVAVPPGGGHCGLTLSLDPGEFVAVRGEPAAGTALARTLAGLAAPVSGSIWFGEQEITGNPPVDRHIGYVPHGGGLLPHLTVQENIAYGLQRRETVRDVMRGWVQTVITQLELGADVQLRPHLISEAHRMRVAIARAVACLPEVLLLDLPYGAPEPLREVLARAESPLASGLAVLVCSADPAIHAEADEVVSLSPAAGVEGAG